jgi:DNA-directed RNA polymerase subunit beta'
MVERVKPEVWDIVEEVIKEHPVMLNRATTLHRLGIQAFEPVLIEGKAIRLHPLVCTAYNADFDGDQMAVHVPLSVEAQAEARFLMLSVNNILAPKDGNPITTPSQDMVLGAYYMTFDKEGEPGEGMVFKDYDEMIMAYENKVVTLHSKVKVRMASRINGVVTLVESTVGRFIFNEQIPQDIGFVDRDEDKYSLEVDFLCTKKKLEQIIAKCFAKHGNTVTAVMLDHMKNMGFKYSTRGAVTVSVSDMVIPPKKKELIADARKMVDKYQNAYRRGLISDEERYKKVIQTWTQTTEDVTDALMENLSDLNNIKIMAHSGARGSRNQIRQLAGMRGLMANAVGKTVEIPIVSNFREGLGVLEYFISTTGARKGLADTALRTADSGYLTRRLVDVSQDVIVRDTDCGTDQGIVVKAFMNGNELIEPFIERIVGRFPAKNVMHPETGEVLCDTDTMISAVIADRIDASGITELEVRSVLTCDTEYGVCSKCYGVNLANGKPVNVGEAVGIIAAQSIGEPGTQLTMRTFHTGGVAGGDITQGLPRVEELFEARKPKGLAVIAEIDGTVSFRETKKKKEVVITSDSGEVASSQIVFGSRLRVEAGDRVKAGQMITDGSVNPHDILRVVGVRGVQEYITSEVQRVYRLQGVDINDKHVEIIIKQMLGKMRIDEPNDANLLEGSVVSVREFNTENKRIVADGGEIATGTRTLLGITKASLATESFLSAASFQETTRVLTDAAINGKEDRLVGLKENVLIGKLIPAGTGMKKYNDVAIQKHESLEPADDEYKVLL